MSKTPAILRWDLEAIPSCIPHPKKSQNPTVVCQNPTNICKKLQKYRHQLWQIWQSDTPWLPTSSNLQPFWKQTKSLSIFASATSCRCRATKESKIAWKSCPVARNPSLEIAKSPILRRFPDVPREILPKCDITGNPVTRESGSSQISPGMWMTNLNICRCGPRVP